MTGLVGLSRIHKKIAKAVHSATYYGLALALALTHVGWVPAQVLAASDARISEFMANSATISDGNGEWIEIENNLDTPLDLTGWTLSEQDGSSYNLSGTIPANDFFLVCRGTSATAGVSCDAENSGLQLNNARGDTITLRNGLAEIVDQVAFEGTNSENSNANPGESAVVHNDGSIVNDSINQYEATGPNFGTPGAESDLLNPVIDITSHNNGDATSSAFTLSGTASDADSGVNFVVVRFYTEGNLGDTSEIVFQENAAYDDLGQTFSLEVTSGDVTDGTYDVTATVRDNAGNGSTDRILPLTVDNIEPETNWDNSQTVFTNDTTPTLTGLSTDIDGSGIVDVELRVEELDATTVQDWTSVTPSDGAFDSVSEAFSATAEALEDGEYRFLARATDRAGNIESTAIIVTVVDTEAPIVSVDSPTDGVAVSGVVDVVASINDDNNFRYYAVLRDSANNIVAGPGTVGSPYTQTSFNLETIFSFDSTTLANGTYTIFVAARDSANNRDEELSVAEHTVTVDNTKPTLQTINPVNDSLHSGTISVSAESTDNIMVDLVEFRVLGQTGWMPLAQEGATDTYSANFDTSTIADGTYDFRFRSTDTAGNVRKKTVSSVTIDNTSPEVTITNPEDWSLLSNQSAITVTGTATDELSGVRRVALVIFDSDGRTVLDAIVNPVTDEFSFEIPAGTLKNEFQRIRIVARDNAQNRGGDTVRVIVDSENPESTLFSPMSDTLWTEPICIAGMTRDNFILDYVNLYAKLSGTTDEEYQLITTITGPSDFSSVPEECEDTVMSLGEEAASCYFDEQVGPEEVEEYYTEGCWYYVWNPLEDGPFFTTEALFDIKASGVDMAGNEEQSAYAYNVLWDVQAPTVDAGPDRTDCVKFTRTGTATDEGSGIATLQWSLVSGPGTVTFGSANSRTTTIVADEIGTYVIRLTATDNAGNTSSDDFTLTWVEDPASAPSFAPHAPAQPAGETDTDGDGFTDAEEEAAGTDPNDPNSFPGSDADDNTDGEEDVLSDEDTSFNFWWIVLLGSAMGALYYLLARNSKETEE